MCNKDLLYLYCTVTPGQIGQLNKNIESINKTLCAKSYSPKQKKAGFQIMDRLLHL